jgi:hypothetical protein
MIRVIGDPQILKMSSAPSTGQTSREMMQKVSLRRISISIQPKNGSQQGGTSPGGPTKRSSSVLGNTSPSCPVALGNFDLLWDPSQILTRSRLKTPCCSMEAAAKGSLDGLRVDGGQVESLATATLVRRRLGYLFLYWRRLDLGYLPKIKLYTNNEYHCSLRILLRLSCEKSNSTHRPLASVCCPANYYSIFITQFESSQ